MVNKQPEALRLADLLEDSHLPVHHKAAAELRRLHAENSNFRATCDHLTRENAEQIGEIVALKEQRDELLEALKGVIEVADFHELYGRRTDAARAAIAKATGETK